MTSRDRTDISNVIYPDCRPCPRLKLVLYRLARSQACKVYIPLQSMSPIFSEYYNWWDKTLGIVPETFHVKKRQLPCCLVTLHFWKVQISNATSGHYSPNVKIDQPLMNVQSSLTIGLQSPLFSQCKIVRKEVGYNPILQPISETWPA